jgi:ubiquinone/menaquinone biosynthesis C-methylase UbiE
MPLYAIVSDAGFECERGEKERMRQSKKSSVQKYHDRVAHRYDDSYDDAYWQWHDSLTWDYIKPHLPRDLGSKLLDLGCGTGKWAAKLVKSGYHVTGVDISPEMLERARGKIEQMGASSRASFVRADLSDMAELASGTYALATAMGDPIGCTTDPVRTMKEIRRVLSPCGILIATFDNRLAALDFYLQGGDPRDLSEFLRHGKTHWLTKDAAERFPITTYGPAEVRKLVEITGFTLMEMIGKTVLPMRHHRALLESPEGRRDWARIEKGLCRDPAAMGRASHIQITCRVTEKWGG